jgi:hypothetical protein
MDTVSIHVMDRGQGMHRAQPDLDRSSIAPVPWQAADLETALRQLASGVRFRLCCRSAKCSIGCISPSDRPLNHRRHPPAAVQAPPPDQAFAQLLRRPVTAQGGGLDACQFFALSLHEQAMLLMLLRVAPHRFGARDAAALLAAAAAGGAHVPELVQQLVGDPQPPVCPDFLFTSAPAFPWAPVLCDPARARAAAEALDEGAPRPPAAAARPDSPSAAGENPKRGPQELAAAAEAGAKRHQAEDPRLEAACRAVRSELGAAAAEGALTPGCAAALDAVLAAATDAAGDDDNDVLGRSGLDALQDDAVLVVVAEAVAAATSYARCRAVAAGVVLPALVRLQGGALSRGLAAAVEHLAACNPAALVDGCLRPLLAPAPGRGLRAAHAELVARAAKALLPAALLPGLVDAACGCGGGAGGEQAATQDASAAGALWSEATVAAVQAAVDAGAALPGATLGALARALQGAAASPALRASAKLGKLLLAVVKAHGAALIGADRTALRAAIDSSTSFMRKPALAALDRLPPT